MPHRYLIFGATGGIGGSLVRLLTAEGNQVAISGRNADSLSRLQAETGATPFPGDLEEWDRAKEIVESAAEYLGGLDGVASCIGSLLLKPAHLTTRDQYDSVLATNLTTSFGIVRAATKALFSSGGSIVLTATAAAKTGIANHDAIATAKAGVIGLTQSPAATYAPRKIRLNCVAPGLVETPLSEAILSNPAGRLASEQMHPLGRIGNAEEIARSIAWLLSPDQGWITGQILAVDGGLSSLLPRARSASTRPS